MTSISSSSIGDMRSDTVTKPTDAMREAMANSVVGDDVLGDDPTVTELEQKMAAMFGKEAAVFVPSGTMANLIAASVHCASGTDVIGGCGVIVGDRSHMHLYEQGGLAYVARAHACVKRNGPDGSLNIAEVEAELKAHTQVTNSHYYEVKLVCIENTHNQCGGRVLTVEYTNALCDVASKYCVPVHIDGARIFNAAVSLNVSVAALVASASSVSVCLSKGVGAPVGSVLLGTHAFISHARRLRKLLGGGMRQVGVLAAPALIGLDSIVPLLSRDHFKATRLANALDRCGVTVVSKVESNLVFVDVGTEKVARDIISELKNQGVLALIAHTSVIRFAIHHQVTDAHIDTVIDLFIARERPVKKDTILV